MKCLHTTFCAYRSASNSWSQRVNFIWQNECRWASLFFFCQCQLSSARHLIASYARYRNETGFNDDSLSIFKKASNEHTHTSSRSSFVQSFPLSGRHKFQSFPYLWAQHREVLMCIHHSARENKFRRREWVMAIVCAEIVVDIIYSVRLYLISNYQLCTRN